MRNIPVIDSGLHRYTHGCMHPTVLTNTLAHTIQKRMAATLRNWV